MQSRVPRYSSPGEQTFHHGIMDAHASPSVAALRRCRRLLRAGQLAELRDEIARSELAGELAELHALALHAILEIREGTGFASDYLEMARGIARSPQERDLVAALSLLAPRDLAAARSGAVSRAGRPAVRAYAPPRPSSRRDR